MLSGNTFSPADLAAVTNGNGGAFGAEGGWLWIIVVFALLFGWGNNGFGRFGENSGIADNYVLTSDFSQLSRQISDSTAMTERKLDGVANGIASLGYDQLNQMNGINTNILTQSNATNTALMQGFNALGSQMSDCCCQTKTMVADLNYNLATQANGLNNSITSGFCQTNYNNATNTRDIIDSQNANTRSILEAIEANKVEALNQRIAEQNQQIASLQLAASQQAQNNYLIGQLRPSPVPSYTVQNPYCNCSCTGCGCA